MCAYLGAAVTSVYFSGSEAGEESTCAFWQGRTPEGSPFFGAPRVIVHSVELLVRDIDVGIGDGEFRDPLRNGRAVPSQRHCSPANKAIAPSIGGILHIFLAGHRIHPILDAASGILASQDTRLICSRGRGEKFEIPTSPGQDLTKVPVNLVAFLAQEVRDLGEPAQVRDVLRIARG